jgi:acyl carrier protein
MNGSLLLKNFNENEKGSILKAGRKMKKIRNIIYTTYSKCTIGEEKYYGEYPEFSDNQRLTEIFDSLFYVETIMAIEDGFSIAIPDEDAAYLHTVEGIYKYLEEKFPGVLEEH